MLSMALSDSNLWYRLPNCDRTEMRFCLATGVSMDMFAQCSKGNVCNISTEKYRLRRYFPCRYSVNFRSPHQVVKRDRNLGKSDSGIVALKGRGALYVQAKEPSLQSASYDGQLWDAQVLDFFAKKCKTGMAIATFGG